MAHQLLDIGFSDFYVKIYKMHTANVKILFCNNKHLPVIDLLQAEKDFNVYNWYFHTMILTRFVNYVKRAKEIQKEQGRDRVLGVVKSVKIMVECYELFEDERKSKLFVKKLGDLVCEIAESAKKLNLDVFEHLVRTYEILLDQSNGEDLLKVTVSLQVFIENDKTYKISQYFSKNIWENIGKGLENDDKDIVQSYKDIITYLAISSQPLFLTYNWDTTTQDKFLQNYLKNSA